jgi:hypothetical protein
MFIIRAPHRKPVTTFVKMRLMELTDHKSLAGLHKLLTETGPGVIRRTRVKPVLIAIFLIHFKRPAHSDFYILS